MKGKCAVCGNIGSLTFEHVPPQSAFNDKPIFIQTHDHLVNEKSFVFGKRMKSNKGLGGYTLCKSCNNLTGDWYARDFASFAQQGMNIISKLQPQPFISGQYQIKPLNVIKQIFTMFLSADKSGHLQSVNGLRDFILNKESKENPKSLKIYLYSNQSPHKRMFGYSIVYAEGQIQKWSEINFQPFGYLLAEDSEPAHRDMVDITSFCDYPFAEEVKLDLRTRYLPIKSPFIGTYF